MNFVEFLNYKTHCPHCNYKLYTKISSTRDYKYRNQGEAIVFSTSMKSISSQGSSVDFDLVVSTVDSSFHLDFYDRSLLKLGNYVPNSFLRSFKEFNKNQKELTLLRRCGNCYSYRYTSSGFDLDFKSAKIDNLVIGLEEIFYYKPLDEEHTRTYKVSYYPLIESTDLSYEDFTKNQFPRTGMQFVLQNKVSCSAKIELFDGAESNIDKIENLITFS